MKKLPQIKITQKYTAFNGGLDITTPPLNMKPGMCRDSTNIYQDINGGNKTFQGYEIFDGQAAPSDAQYAMLTCDITGSVSTGDVLTDDAGTSYGTVIALPEGEAVLTKITGTFSTGNIKVGAVVVGTCTGAQVIDGAATRKLHAQYKNLAADEYRSDIGAIPGSGDVRGIWYYDGAWYGFRNNAGDTAMAMYKSTSSGWTLVDLGYELAFTSGGTYEIAAADTILGASSGAIAIVRRVVLESGAFNNGTAVGKLIVTNQVGTFQAENINVGANPDVATISGDSSEITFANPSGRFEFRNANFTGSTSTLRMYGVDGVNRGFEFDGSIFVPISTGMTTDTPSHIYEHKNHLFYSYYGSIQHSAPGYPYQWSILSGGDEIGMGDEITGFESMPGSESSATLAVFTRNSTAMLYGTSSDDWNLVHYKKEAGAIEWSQQLIGNCFMLDDRGITKLKTSQVYGNFADATASKLIQPWLRTKKVQLTASCVVRDLNQYWLFFEDKTALCCTIDNGEIVASFPMLFADKITCACSTEDSSGDEVIMLGSEDGKVFQMYKGTSFDGEEIEWSLDLAYEHYGAPEVNKHFRRAMLEAEGDGYAEFYFSYSLEYGASDIQQPAATLKEMDLSGASWDVGVWDVGVWDGSSLSPVYFRMHGSATNVSIKLHGKSDYFSPVRFSGVVVSFNYTRQKK